MLFKYVEILSEQVFFIIKMYSWKFELKSTAKLITEMKSNLIVNIFFFYPKLEILTWI